MTPNHHTKGIVMNIEKEIDNRIHKSGGGYPAWYVGTTTNPRKQLFEGHNVVERAGAWLYRDAGSESTAKTIEAIFLKRGCKGMGKRGGQDSSRYIYAYKMTRTTRGSQS